MTLRLLVSNQTDTSVEGDRQTAALPFKEQVGVHASSRPYIPTQNAQNGEFET